MPAWRGHTETGDLNSAPLTSSAGTPHPSAVHYLHLAIWTWLTCEQPRALVTPWLCHSAGSKF